MKPSEDILRQLPKKFHIGWTEEGLQVDFLNELSGVVLAIASLEGTRESHARTKARNNLLNLLGKLHTYSEYWREKLKELLPQAMSSDMRAEKVSPKLAVERVDSLIVELRAYAEQQKINQHMSAIRLLLWKIVCALHGEENAQVQGFQSVLGILSEQSRNE